MILDEEVRTFPEVMIPVFDILLGRIKDLELCQILFYAYLDILLYFTRQKDMAKVGLKVVHTHLHWRFNALWVPVLNVL